MEIIVVVAVLGADRIHLRARRSCVDLTPAQGEGPTDCTLNV
jgi:hypothetical protein